VELKGGNDVTTGQLDPKIKIRAPLRCDGIGRLDCAEHVDSGMRMAVRWLPLDANGDAAAKAMVELPAHPTLPRIRQSGRVGSAAYVAMDFPDGRLLSTMLEKPMPVEDLMRMGAEIAEALATLHAQSVHHGEVSADSLLLVPNEKAILWDMPLVIANRFSERRGEERAMSQLVRTAPFLSPERAQGMPASASSDVYALGAVMCLAGGGRPPAAATTLATLWQVASGKWSPEVPSGYPSALRALMARMLNRDPLARPSASEVAELLSKPLAAVPTIPEMPVIVPVAAAAADPVKKALELVKKPLVLLAAGMGALILVLTAVVIYFATRPPQIVTSPVMDPQVTYEVVDPVQAEESAEDVLAPLPPKAAVRPVAMKPATAPALAAKKSAEAEAAPKAEDFSFLQGAEEPESELKRPTF
jgi:eukaryotic-like serine/threonine-protein kinase